MHAAGRTSPEMAWVWPLACGVRVCVCARTPSPAGSRPHTLPCSCALARAPACSRPCFTGPAGPPPLAVRARTSSPPLPLPPLLSPCPTPRPASSHPAARPRSQASSHSRLPAPCMLMPMHASVLARPNLRSRPRARAALDLLAYCHSSCALALARLPPLASTTSALPLPHAPTHELAPRC